MRVVTERSYKLICQRCRVTANARPLIARKIWSSAGAIPRISSQKDLSGIVQRPSRLNVGGHIGQYVRPATFSANQSEKELQELQKRGTAQLGPSDGLASEVEVEELLKKCLLLASQFAEARRETSKDSSKEQGNPAAALLGLDHAEQSPPVPPPSSPDPTKGVVDALSELAYQTVIHPHVFFSEAVLRIYVTLQALLQRPESFPEIFSLYATKPMPIANSKPVKYKKPNPKRAQFAIPPGVAVMALDSAIRIKDLELALAIIEGSYATPAFRRAKIIRKALLPGAALTLTPLAAYVVASRVSADSLAGDGYLTTEVAFAAILTYVGFTGMLGFVALTTANDQMQRVTWVPGTPLRERWLREDERAAIDKVATAWGFKNPLRRGEEEGEEWEALRNWIARKGMILDKESLMPGMN